MHRHLAKHSTFLSLWLVAASVSMPVATAQARVHIPAKPSVEINLDVLQHLSDVLPEGAAPVDDIEEQEVGAYRPRREHAARKVPEENPYTPPVSKAKPRKTTRSSTTGEPPFYLGKSPAARIESRPLPRITEKKKAPKAAPVKITKKKTPPKPKAETPPPPPPLPPPLLPKLPVNAWPLHELSAPQ